MSDFTIEMVAGDPQYQMNESMLDDTCAPRVTPSNFAAVKVLKASSQRHNLKSAAHFCSLLCPGMLHACAANTKLTIYPNRSKPTVLVFFNFTESHYQSHISLAFWELISLDPKLHPCQLKRLPQMTCFVTVPRQ